jgi:DNA-binding CsgD family transcriptional regulator
MLGFLVATKQAAGDIVFAFSERSRLASSLGALAALLFEAAEQLGFRYVACGAHIDLLNPPDGAFLIHNYPADWVERFTRKQYHRLDPVLRYAETTLDAFSWDDPAFLAGLTERQARVLNEARMFSLAHGHTIPLSHDLYLPASCSFVSETGDVDPLLLAIARAVMIPIYARASLLARDGRLPKGDGKLSPRERACLALKSDGAEDWEVAAALKISLSTARRHIEQAKRRLAAKTREHAVSLAIQSRQIK